MLLLEMVSHSVIIQLDCVLAVHRKKKSSPELCAMLCSCINWKLLHVNTLYYTYHFHGN